MCGPGLGWNSFNIEFKVEDCLFKRVPDRRYVRECVFGIFRVAIIINLYILRCM